MLLGPTFKAALEEMQLQTGRYAKAYSKSKSVCTSLPWFGTGALASGTMEEPSLSSTPHPSTMSLSMSCSVPSIMHRASCSLTLLWLAMRQCRYIQRSQLQERNPYTTLNPRKSHKNKKKLHLLAPFKYMAQLSRIC